MKRKKVAIGLGFLFGFTVGIRCSAFCREREAVFLVEAGPAWVTRNDVRIPGNEGTSFSLNDVIGNSPVGTVRIEGHLIGKKNGWRCLIAPFQTKGTGVLHQPTQFAGTLFSADTPTEGLFRFDSYRLTYWVRLKNKKQNDYRLGLTAKLRDAEIKLTQNNQSAGKANTGLVPLIYFYAKREIGFHWDFIFDFDGLMAPQGRAFDVAVKFNRQWNKGWSSSLSYRFLEGGADNDEVYSFAWIHYALVSINYQF